MRQEVVGAAVDIPSGNDMIAGSCDILNRISYGSCSAGNGQGCNTAFQRCNSLLQNLLGRVGETAVDIPRIF